MKMLYRVLFVIYVTILLWLSLSTPTGIVKFAQDFSIFRLDYTLHVVGFIPMPIISYLASGHREHRALWHFFMVLTFLLSFALEYVQMLVPGRRFNPLDMLFNVIGVMVGLVAIYFAHRHIKKFSRETEEKISSK
ncbi:MAG: VanZ family protein [Rikenellaceae bacterium]|jgi:VanZ family protein|nr:hypothetical protein [Bacteroidales bacterium]NLH56947.1 VanZ family protein [Rikenellaceae bacterium]OQC63493.1 MAG: VanZ like family protein [Bacteroidetes bacterium ADurb.Bin008]HOF91412.1 VanZ family protein [Tenuifilaceae bacterium]HOM85507.1 VanZ family protein [Tenuifilaceae bacterium]